MKLLLTLIGPRKRNPTLKELKSKFLWEPGVTTVTDRSLTF